MALQTLPPQLLTTIGFPLLSQRVSPIKSQLLTKYQDPPPSSSPSSHPHPQMIALLQIGWTPHQLYSNIWTESSKFLKERCQAKFLEGQFCRYKPGRPLIGPSKPRSSVGCAQHFFVRVKKNMFAPKNLVRIQRI